MITVVTCVCKMYNDIKYNDTKTHWSIKNKKIIKIRN